MQVCPKEGNSPTILFWDHQSYLIERGLDSLGLIGIVILEFGIGKDFFTWKKKGVKNSNNCCWWFRNPAPVEVGIVFSLYLQLVGGFKDSLFSPLLGEDSHFDEYFSDGLKPPTRQGFTNIWGGKSAGFLNHQQHHVNPIHDSKVK